MNKKIITKTLLLMFIIFCTCTLTSCVMDRVTSFCIRNSTNDSLYIELSESDTLDNLIYWCKNSKETMSPIMSKDTTWAYINGEKVIIDNFFYALPDSTVLVSPYLFNIKDTCYIYAIKRRIATHYSLEEIRKKKLYDRQTVTKKDFNHNCIFEYKTADSSRRH